MIDEQDFRTPVWKKLDTFLRERIDQHRTALESPDLSETETAMLRARIAECRHIQSLPRFRAAELEQSPPDTQYY